jgi:hypothetical protein
MKLLTPFVVLCLVGCGLLDTKIDVEDRAELLQRSGCKIYVWKEGVYGSLDKHTLTVVCEPGVNTQAEEDDIGL